MPIKQMHLHKDSKSSNRRPFVRIAGVKEGEEEETLKTLVQDIADEENAKLFLARLPRHLEVQFARDAATSDSDVDIMRHVVMKIMSRFDS